MSEPFERALAKKLEVKLGVALAKWEALLHAGAGCGPRTDACLRTAACIAVAVAGFWYPLWCELKLRDPDSRLGIVGVFAFPAIAFLAVRASRSIFRGFEEASHFIQAALVALALALVILCWIPLIYMAIALVGGILGRVA